MQDISLDDTSRIKKSRISFIWNNKQDKIKRKFNVICQDYINGRLQAPDPNALFKSLRLAPC